MFYGGTRFCEVEMQDEIEILRSDCERYRSELYDLRMENERLENEYNSAQDRCIILYNDFCRMRDAVDRIRLFYSFVVGILMLAHLANYFWWC
jgi:predicted nuclease with TOPRIM domain